ncbi:TonB-dependent receptor [Oleisolibacter albus]|uniref:TonB-dependent receptor n=1 Tax=Oleisolibacter albus TaxID=2171757 RepID=UPI001EFCAB0E|nr:TonB-dependent receptor [Oleisolibacter albus]
MFARTLSSTVALLALVAPAAAMAERYPGEAERYPSPLDEVVVTANRRAAAVRDVPASVSSIDLDTAETQATRFVGEELRGLPGVTLATNDQGTYTGITLRGVPNRIHNDTLAVLMDGVPFLTGDDEADLEQLPFGAAGRVDLVRGPMSALYGRGAIAGTINYRTPEVGDSREGRVRATVGSDGWRELAASLQTPTVENGALLLSGQVQTADGWRDRTGRDEQSLFAKHRLTLKEWGRLNLTATYVNTKQKLAGELPTDALGQPIDLPGGREANYNEDNASFAKRMLTSTAVLEADLAEGLTSTTRLHARQAKTAAIQGAMIRYTPGDSSLGYSGFRVDGDTNTLFAEQQLDWQRGDWRLQAGASAEQVRAHHVETWTGEFDFGPLFYAQRRDIATGAHINRDDWISDRMLDGHSRARNYAVYSQAEWTHGPLTLTGGARWDSFGRRVFYGPSGSGYGPNPVQTVEDRDQQVTPKASASWKFSPDLTAYVAYGEGFSPGFGPIWSYLNRNTGVDPERARNIEAGVKGSLFERLSYTLTAYQLNRSDLLQLLPVNGTAVSINSGKERVRGLELESRLDLADAVPGLSLDASYGYTFAKWTENAYVNSGTGVFYDFSGKEVAGIPRHAGRLTVNQEIAPWDLTVQVWADLSGDYAYDKANSVRAGGYALYNAALVWQPLDRLELTLTVRNLFDREVNSILTDDDGAYAYFPQAPRQWFLSAQVSF